MDTPQTTLCLTRFSAVKPGSDEESEACLVRIYPHSIGEGIINLPVNDIIIGRDKACPIQLEDPSVSRQHASIQNSASIYKITDLDSCNGIFINDKKITSATLQSGDLIRIGHTIFKFLSCDHIEKQYHEEIYNMMITDGLTHIPNKRYFLEILEREFSRAHRHERPLSLIMFDIDHFKKINDTYGHLAGDIILRDLCQRISPFIRNDEVFARYGGEEFAILLPESSLNEGKILCKKLLNVISSKAFNVEHFQIPATISMGITEINRKKHQYADDLVMAADKKLYQAKNSGRNCYIS